jgi:hypothetical protein
MLREMATDQPPFIARLAVYLDQVEELAGDLAGPGASLRL